MENKLESFFTETDVEILISTMNQNSLDFLVQMFPFLHFSNLQILIVNQTQTGKELLSIYPNVRIINSFEKGLTKTICRASRKPTSPGFSRSPNGSSTIT